jgi:hypothetical protein
MKQGASETDATTREMRRKAKQIAPAYNKGTLQYLPGGQKDEWPDRDEQIATPQKEEPVENRKPTT